MKVLIIVPAYNEENNIEAVIADIQKHFPTGDILVVNDCSTDCTPIILQKLGVRHLDLSANLGIGGAVQAGYKYALKHGYDIAVQFDGDGQHSAEYLLALIKPLEEGKANVAIGSRFVEKQGFQSSAARRTGIGFLSTVIRLLSGVIVKDVTSGMRAVDRKMIECYADEYAQDYPEPEAILQAGIQGAKIVEVPVQMRERASGKSSITAFKSVYYMVKVSLSMLISRMSMERKRR